MIKPFLTVIAANQLLGEVFSEESFLKGSHTVRPVWCVSTCVHLCAFYLFTCGGCDVEPTIRKRPACLKSLSVLSFVFLFCFHSSFLLPLFPPLRFTRPSLTSSKGLLDTPLSDALSPTALQSPHSVHVCERKHLSKSLRDLTLSTRSASSEQRKWKTKNKKRGEWGWVAD